MSSASDRQDVGGNVAPDVLGRHAVFGQVSVEVTEPAADVEYAGRRGVVEPGCEAVLDKFRDRRARDEDSRVDRKTQPGEPRLTREVGCRQALGHAVLEQGQHGGALAAGECGIQKLRRDRQVEVQYVPNQYRRLVGRAGGAVTEKNPGGSKTAGAEAQEIAQRA